MQPFLIELKTGFKENVYLNDKMTLCVSFLVKQVNKIVCHGG